VRDAGGIPLMRFSSLQQAGARQDLFSRSVIILALFFSLVFGSALRAQETVVTLDPAHTEINFTLGATMHTVHGTFKLKRGEIRFDSATGKAGGAIVVDTTSGDTGNSGRDSKMHKEILESQKYPEAVFTPATVKSKTPRIIPAQGTSQVDVSGVFRLHGQDHDMTLTFSVSKDAGAQLQASTQFQIPYIQWGLKSPNTFLLHVSDTLDMEVHSKGQVSPAALRP
jgi:polyisoprenoid-binding protein YceI